MAGPLLCVAGYVFTKRKAREFGRKWSAYLTRKGLPYFHMSECAHGAGVFKGKDCDGIARELIRRTRQDAEFGFAVVVNESDYDELIAPHEGLRSAYAFALAMGVHHVALWRERAGQRGETAFFFENGHRHQTDANGFLTWLLGNEALRSRVGYTSHAFVPKATPALHPADNLAWHWRLEVSRSKVQPRRYPMRGDFKALLRPGDIYAELTRERMVEFSDLLRGQASEREARIKIALETGVMPV